MKIKWEGEKLNPSDIARRILDGKIEAAYFWEDVFRDNPEDTRPTAKQIQAIHKQVVRLADSIRKRYRLKYDAGRQEK